MTSHTPTARGSDADEQLNRFVALLDRTLGFVLAALMFAMMLLTFCDVVGRQVFEAPILGSNELTQIAMGLVVYIGLPLVCIRREHISIGLLAGLFRGSALRFQHAFLNLLFAATTFVWARQVWIQGEAVERSNSVLMFLQVSTAPYIYFMSIMTFAAAAIFLVLAWCYLRGATPKSGIEGGGE
jgi:TRAP-type C4-dicarboxylate transport system permease small subunit